MSEFTFSSIGSVTSCFKEKFATPRQSGLVKSAQATIKFDASVQPELALLGLEDFSHIWVIYVFHKNTNRHYKAKVNPPRLLGESVGCLASRSPHRPNPMGLSLVKLEAVHADSIVVSGVDFIEGTPVLDIKPYMPETEALPRASCGWTEGLVDLIRPVEFSAELMSAEVIVNMNSADRDQLKTLVSESLSREVRPLNYKAEGCGPLGGNRYAVRLDKYDVHFEVNGDRVLVYDLKHR